MAAIWTFAALAWAARDTCPSILAQADKAFKARDAAGATAHLERALEACPDRAPVFVSLGQMRYLQGKEAEAEKFFLKAVDANPRDTRALYAAGRLFYEQHRYPEAVVRLEAAVKIDPADHRAWDNLGLCYDALQRDSDALRAFFKALDLVMKSHPSYDWAHANLADFFLRREQFEKAFQLAAEAASRNPESARNAFLTGKALVKLGKHGLSLRWLERCVKLDEGYAEAWYLLSQAYRALQRPEDAEISLARFKQAKERSPQPRR